MKNRLGLKVISLLLGIVAWAYVNLVNPPMVRRNIIAEIEYRNKPELMKVLPERPRVEIEIEGSRRDFVMSGAKKAVASVDLYNLRPGKALLPVEVTPSSGLSVKTVKPAQIQIDAVALIRKELPVEIIIRGQTAEGYLAEKPRINPEKVMVEGPQRLVKRIETCLVEVVLEKVKNSISENRPVKVILDSGASQSEIKVIPDEVSVDVTVKQGYPSKIVPLAKPVFLNKPPEGKKLEEFSLYPEKIMLSGPARALEQIDEQGFAPIDLSKLADSASLSLKLEFPHKRINPVGSASAYIDIKLADTKITRLEKGLRFELQKGSQQHTSVSVSSYTIELEGFAMALDRIKTADLKLVLDVEDMKPGVYDVPLTVPSGLPPEVKVLNIYPEAVQIKISQRSLTDNASQTNKTDPPSTKNKKTEDSELE
jgi:YbbR domain-containing protein